MNRKTIIEMNQQNKSQVFGPLFDKYNQVLEKRGHKLHKVGKLHLDPMLCLHTKIFGNSLRTDNLLINKFQESETRVTFLEDFPHVKTFSIGGDKFGFSISFQPEYKDITITQRKPLKNQGHFQLSSCRDEEGQGFTTAQNNTTKQLSLVFDVMGPIFNSQQLRNITGQYIESKYPQNTFSKKEVVEFLNLLFDDLLK